MFFVSTCFNDRPAWRCLDAVSGAATQLETAALRHRSAAGAQLLQSLAAPMSARIALILDPEAELVVALVAAERAQLEYAVFDPAVEPVELGRLLVEFAPNVLIAAPGRISQLHNWLQDWLQELQSARSQLQVFTLRQESAFGPCWEAAVDAYHLSHAWTDAWTDAWQGPSRAVTYSAGSTRIPIPVRRADALLTDGLTVTPVRSVTEAHYLLTGACAHWGTVGRLLYCLRHGIEVTVLRGFDAAVALAALTRLGITHSVWGPQMLAAVAALPRAMRARYVGRVHREAWVGGAFCAADVLQTMLGWWGPILHVHYGGIEICQSVTACSAELLERAESVGRALGVAVRDDSGVRVPAGQLGRVWFEVNCAPGAKKLTLDDLGYLDNAGYLFLVDRCGNGQAVKDVMVYPGEAERVLAAHPAVADVAVVWAEVDGASAASDAGAGASGNQAADTQLIALIVLRPAVEANPLQEVALLDYARARLSQIKCPQQARFIESLPRQACGRLQRRSLARTLTL